MVVLSDNKESTFVIEIKHFESAIEKQSNSRKKHLVLTNSLNKAIECLLYISRSWICLILLVLSRASKAFYFNENS